MITSTQTESKKIAIIFAWIFGGIGILLVAMLICGCISCLVCSPASSRAVPVAASSNDDTNAVMMMMMLNNQNNNAKSQNVPLQQATAPRYPVPPQQGGYIGQVLHWFI